MQNSGGLADFLIINTAHDHYTEAAAKTGTFGLREVAALDRYLGNTARLPLRIAVLHHHPIQHSSTLPDATQLLPTGQQLLDVLARHGFKIIMHGHRHQPRIRRHPAGGSNLHVLCAGSFSAFLPNEHGSVTRNVFHHLELSCDGAAAAQPTGTVRTWEFNCGLGWNPATPRSAGLPHSVPIGPAPQPGLAGMIDSHMSLHNLRALSGEDLWAAFPSVGHLLPDELDELWRELFDLAQLSVTVDLSGSCLGLWRA